MSDDRQFDKKRMLKAVDDLIVELSENEIRNANGGEYIVICYGVRPIFPPENGFAQRPYYA